MEKYSVYSKFDVDKHKDTFDSYLEVMILEDGSIEYAVPSHQEKAIKLACEKLQISRSELDRLCPRMVVRLFNVASSVFWGRCGLGKPSLVLHNISKANIGFEDVEVAGLV